MRPLSLISDVRVSEARKGIDFLYMWNLLPISCPRTCSLLGAAFYYHGMMGAEESNRGSNFGPKLEGGQWKILAFTLKFKEYPHSFHRLILPLKLSLPCTIAALVYPYLHLKFVHAPNLVPVPGN